MSNFFTTKQSPTLESFKEFLRVLVLGLGSFVVTELIGWLEASSLQEVWVVVLLAGLRWLDKWLHQSGKVERGITRF